MNYTASDPRSMLWYCFWHDLWKCNGKMKKLKNLGQLLDPASATAIAFRIMPPRELDRVLGAAGLRKANSLFSDKTLACLYERLAAKAAGGEGDGEGDLPRLFAALDANQNGELTREEVVAGHALLKMSEDKAAELFDSLDVNGDGVLTKGEFGRRYMV